MASDLVNLMEQKMTISMKTIDSMPNELVRTILTKETVHKLISIRAVSKRWKAIIEDICQSKNSMVLSGSCVPFQIYELSHRFNRLIDLNTNNYAVLEVKSYRIGFSQELCTWLAKLFPQVEHLYFISSINSLDSTNLVTLLKNWSSTIVTLYFPEYQFFPHSPHDQSHLVPVANQIDRLTALKHLSIEFSASLKPSTLAQLEHCYLANLPATAPHLAPGCTSLYVHSSYEMYQLPEHFRANVTRLGLSVPKNEFEFVCAHFSALQVLTIRVTNRALFNAYMITQLARLTKLSELSIGLCNFDLPIHQAPSSLSSSSSLNLPALGSIRTLTLSRFIRSSNGQQFDGDYEQLCRELSNIFPNVTQLNIEGQSLADGDGISRYSHHFAHLRKYLVIKCVSFKGSFSSDGNSRW